MKLRAQLAFALCLGLSTFACAGSPGDDVDATETSDDEAALSARAKKIAGTYTSQSGGRPPRFSQLRLRPDGGFDATVDTGIRCITTPCDSSAWLYGTYSAGAKYLTLKPTDGNVDHAELYGRYKYVVTVEGGLFLERAGRDWQGWSDDLARAPGILPDDATKIVAESPGGGFVRPGPAGSCTPAKQNFSLDLTTRKLTWSFCEYNATGPYQTKAGSRTISTREQNKVLEATRAASIAVSSPCGADKPFLKVLVSSPDGTKEYYDSFYSCQGGNRTYIDGIGGIFHAMQDLTN